MGNIRIKNLKVSYDDQHEVFKDVNFFLRKGATLSIIGTSGSGKTTILRCINQLETADSGFIKVNGEVFFDGENKVKKEDPKEKRRKHEMTAERIQQQARVNTKRIQERANVNTVSAEEKEAKVKKATEYYNNNQYKAGSIASKANMVKQFDEKGKKK